MKDSGLMLQMVHTAMKRFGVDVTALYRQLGSASLRPNRSHW